MSTRRVANPRFTIIAAMVIAATVSTAQAQQNQNNGPQPQNGAAPAPKPAPLPATPQEFNAQGDAILQRGTALSQTVRAMLEEARKEGDIIKVTCLDNKLTQIDVNMHTAESRLDAMKKAVDNDRRTHEFTVLTVLGQKLQVLDQEAHQCVGQSMYDTGKTKVTTEIDTSQMPYEPNPSMPPVITPPALPTIPPPVSSPK